MFTHETFRKDMDGPKRDTMALVMVDKDKLLLENAEKVEETENRFAGEQKDGLSALIKDWSTSSRTFWRRDSCEFTTCVAPCVKKATSHLQQLQEQLNKCSLSQQQVQELSKGSDSRNVSAIGDRSVSSRSPYSDVRTLVSDGAVELSSLTSSPVSRERSFFSGMQELSSSRQFSPSLASRAKTTTRERNSAVYRMGYNVVDEVLRLLRRLERDRLATQEMMIQERRRVGLLKSEIDRLAFKRLTELPTAVQNEHESCTTDINELKWHCSYQGRVEARIKRRVGHAETMHAKFIEDVESSTQSCPLVKEKLDLESQAMASIQAKQDETDEELQQTLKRLEATEMKTAEAKERGTQERMLIKQDVDIIRNLLNEVSDELAQLKMNYTSNVHTISDIKNTLKENAQQCQSLEKREEKVKSQESSTQEKVVKLKEKITDQGSEHVRLMAENEKLRQDNLTTEGNYQTSIANLKMEIKQYEIHVREFSRKNKAMREDMDSTSKHTEKCKKQKTSDKKALVRAGQEVENIMLQNEMMVEEIKKVNVLNQSLKTTKAQRDEEYFVEEETFRSAESSLRSQLKEESHARTVLQARIAADTSDLLKSRVQSKKKKANVTLQAAEVHKVVTRIKEQVSKLDKVHTEREKTISQMNEILEKLSKQREDMESKYRARIAELRPKEDIAKKEKLELEKQIDQITWKSDMMQKKMEDMFTSSEMMSRVINSTQEDISELEEDNTETKLRLQASVETDASLKQALEDSKERAFTREEDHSTHLEKRRAVLDDTTTSLQEKLGENKTLAEKYQKLHSTFLQTKEAFFKDYESLVNEESHLKDHKEIYTLQGRMRECLQHYYKLRGLHNKSQVAQFQLNSKENNNKLFELKQDLTNVITHINNFLESNNAADKTISVEAANVTQTAAVR